MALITVPSVAKGSPSTVSLSKAELFALAAVSQDAYFSLASNVKYAVFVFDSNPGNQRKILRFDLSEATPSAEVLISSTGRDSFELIRVILEDKDGGSLSVERAQLPTGLDITIGGGGQQQGGGQQGGGGGGGGGQPQAPGLISSGLVVQLETETLVSGQYGVEWTDAISQRSFFPISNFFGGQGGGQPSAMISQNYFGSRSALRLQNGMKLHENTGGGAPVLQSAGSITVIVVGAANSESEFLTLANNTGMPYGTIKTSQYNPYMGFGSPMPRQSVEAFGEFYSMGQGGGSAEVAATDALPYSNQSKVLGLVIPNRASTGAKFFLNGTKATTGAQSNSMSGIYLPNDVTINVGGYYPGPSQDLSVGAVLVYDRALSDAEMASLSSYLMTRYTVA